jgi:hypothetical protein
MHDAAFHLLVAWVSLEVCGESKTLSLSATPSLCCLGESDCRRPAAAVVLLL